MCMFQQPDYPDPQMPPERQAQRAPNAAQASEKAQRTTDQLRAGASTILTSGSGVTTNAATDKKTLLGQ